MGWEAGIQYDGDVFRAAQVLQNLSTYSPGATEYEVSPRRRLSSSRIDSQSPTVCSQPP
jgi:hypothetical protein